MQGFDTGAFLCYIGLLIYIREKSHPQEHKMINAEMIVLAIRALGFAPVTVPSHIPNGICMLPAKHGQLEHRLHTMAEQFGCTWELHTFGSEYRGLDNSYGYWILEV